MANLTYEQIDINELDKNFDFIFGSEIEGEIDDVLCNNPFAALVDHEDISDRESPTFDDMAADIHWEGSDHMDGAVSDVEDTEEKQADEQESNELVNPLEGDNRSWADIMDDEEATDDESVVREEEEEAEAQAESTEEAVEEEAVEEEELTLTHSNSLSRSNSLTRISSLVPVVEEPVQTPVEPVAPQVDLIQQALLNSQAVRSQERIAQQAREISDQAREIARLKKALKRKRHTSNERSIRRKTQRIRYDEDGEEQTRGNYVKDEEGELIWDPPYGRSHDGMYYCADPKCRRSFTENRTLKCHVWCAGISWRNNHNMYGGGRAGHDAENDEDERYLMFRDGRRLIEDNWDPYTQCPLCDVRKINRTAILSHVKREHIEVPDHWSSADKRAYKKRKAEEIVEKKAKGPVATKGKSKLLDVSSGSENYVSFQSESEEEYNGTPRCL
tara:strand:+ start:558 stop:1892 length:1335 start_codon:yes stop_codon:yes gene_type:complete